MAAFFCEPVIGAGGVHAPPEGYIEGVADLCAEHGILFVVDSVICGFGRLGTWYGIERWEDVRPDMITFAKGVTAGYLPLGGVVVSERVAGPFFESPGGPMLRHGATYAGHPACCAAGLAVLDIYERDGLIERGRELEGALAEALAPLASHDAVAEVRAGLGMMGRGSNSRPRCSSATAAHCRRSPRARARPVCSCARCPARSACRRRSRSSGSTWTCSPRRSATGSTRSASGSRRHTPAVSFRPGRVGHGDGPADPLCDPRARRAAAVRRRLRHLQGASAPLSGL